MKIKNSQTINKNDTYYFCVFLNNFFKKIYNVKILNFYILQEFLLKFLAILAISGILAFLIEFVSKIGNFNLFDFFLNLGNIFSFSFFIAASWCLISFERSRELIMFQVSTVSVIKIAFFFLLFSLFFGFFYLFIYNGIFLQSLSGKNPNKNLTLSRFSIYNKITDCDFEVLLAKNITFNHSLENFTLQESDFIKFEKCEFTKHLTLTNEKIENNNNALLFASGLKMDYDFTVFAKYFKEKVKSESFKTFYQKIQLIYEFEKLNIENHKLKVEVFEAIQTVISFFYMILVAFLFFANAPPRTQFLVRFFFAICLVATIYILNMILMGWINQFSLLNPALILTPSVIIFFFLFSVIVLKKA